MKYLICLLFVSMAAARYTSDTDNLSEYIKTFTSTYKSTSCQDVTSNPVDKVDPEKVHVRLHYSNNFQAANMKNYQEIFKYPQYDPDRETKVIIHGWLQQDQIEQDTHLAQLYALRGKKVNLISIDWYEYACLENYEYTATHYVQDVAYMLADLIKYIQKNSQQPIHMIGFDMGAHIAGVAAKKTTRKVERITALSPAGRYFEEMPATNKLVKGDALYTDVIATNQGGAGYSKNMGDIDFLPNGGRVQPLAENTPSQVIKDVLSHMASVAYYLESVEMGYRGFIGKLCDSWKNFHTNKCYLNQAEIMGEAVSQRRYGVYYLYVNKGGVNQFYSQGVYGLYRYDQN